MPRPRCRRAPWLTGLAAAGCVVLVWQTSGSAFSTDTADSSRAELASSRSGGSLALSLDNASTARFTATNLKPGATGTRCLAITSSGRLPATVKMYGTEAATSRALASWITLTITQGSGSRSGRCAGFTPLPTGARLYSGTLARFARTATSYRSGLGTWAPTGAAPQTRVFRISYTLQAGTPNSAQAGTAAITFTWEAQQRAG